LTDLDHGRNNLRGGPAEHTVSRFLAEIRETLVPDRDSKHGPLPLLMVAMTFVTGLVDAFSFLVLGMSSSPT
jgi:hypothetical protein